jgi:hypothetical protein
VSFRAAGEHLAIDLPGAHGAVHDAPRRRLEGAVRDRSTSALHRRRRRARAANRERVRARPALRACARAARCTERASSVDGEAGEEADGR